MLSTIGVQSIQDLFSAIPPKIRENAGFQLDMPVEGDRPQGMSEHELREFFGTLASKNACAPEYQHFLGGGIYDNIFPAAVDSLSQRGEFLTCYTPYQPEISQGTLQAIFEFQTLITRLTGMEVSNASLYDNHTGVAEAVLMATRVNPKGRGTWMTGATNPDTVSVARTFTRHEAQIDAIPWTDSGEMDLQWVRDRLKEHVPRALVVTSPNYFGVLEPLAELKSLLPESVVLIVNVPDASSLSLIEPPGAIGADIVVGEAQQLAIPMSFGGPHVGFFATQKRHLRQLPGRLVGETKDSRGQRCYSLTLATREQHIRRERATSNICTNQGLVALRATIYLSLLGKKGFETLGETNYSLFHYLAEQLAAVGIPQKFSGDHFREGVFEVPNLNSRFEAAVKKKLIPGIRLQPKGFGDEFSQSLLIATHPKLKKRDIDSLVEVLSHD